MIIAVAMFGVGTKSRIYRQLVGLYNGLIAPDPESQLYDLCPLLPLS